MLENKRKFIVFMLVYATITLLLLFHKISEDVFMQVMIYTVGLYMAGNASEHLSDAWRGRKDRWVDE